MGKKKSKKRAKKPKRPKPKKQSPQIRQEQVVAPPDPGCFWAEKWGINLIILARYKNDDKVETASVSIDGGMASLTA